MSVVHSLTFCVLLPLINDRFHDENAMAE